MDIKAYINEIDNYVINYFTKNESKVIVLGTKKYIDEFILNIDNIEISKTIIIDEEKILNDARYLDKIVYSVNETPHIPIINCCKFTDRIFEFLGNKIEGRIFHYFLVKILNNIEEIQKVYEKLEDEKSKNIILKLIEYYITQNKNIFNDIYNGNRQYFLDEFKVSLSDSIFVDGGAFDGSNTVEYISLDKKFKKIYVFEPDNQNYIKTKINLKDYNLDNNIEILNIALGHRQGECYFDNSNKSDASICNKSDYKVKINSLDNIIENNRVDFIKLDIEGSELEALHGAEQVICNSTPIMTICIYHKPQDLYEIVQYINSINNGYKYYIRHHNNECRYETVLYCIPKLTL